MSEVILKRFKKSDFLPNRSTFSDVKTTFAVDLDSKSNGSRKKILERDEDIEYFAKALNRTEAELKNPNSDFWRDFTFVMSGESVKIDKNEPNDALVLKMLKADSRVITCDEDRLTKSKAEYIIEDLEEITEKRIKNRSIKIEAYVVFDKMSDDDLKEAILMFGKNPRDLKASRIKEIVGDELEKDPAKFLNIVTDKYYHDKVFINDMVQEGLMKKSGAAFMYDGEIVGIDNKAVLIYVKDPKNANWVISMKKALNDKKGMIGNKAYEV